MTRVAAALVVAALIALSSAQVPPAPLVYAWEGMYAPPYLRNPSAVTSFTCVNSTYCFIAGAVNGQGFGVYTYDGQMNGQTVRMTDENTTVFIPGIDAIQLDGQVYGSYGSVEMLGKIGGPIQYLVNGNEWKASKMPWELAWGDDGLSMAKDGSITAAVGISPIINNNIMVSRDRGATYTIEKINYSNGPVPQCNQPSNIFVASENLWFVTYGTEPQRHPPGPSTRSYIKDHETVVKTAAAGRVVFLKDSRTGAVRQYVKTFEDVKEDIAAMKKVGDNPNPCTFFYGEILRSTDQGKTWTSSYINKQMLINGITCFNENRCAAMAFNAGMSIAVVSNDGGKTFKEVLHTPQYPPEGTELAIERVDWRTDSELWAMGARLKQNLGYPVGSAIFWVSNDAGQTWKASPNEIPDVMAVMGASFVDGVGIMVGATRFNTVQIARYKLQSDYGSFTQVKCAVKGCDVLCQNYSFPSGLCIYTQGGSVKAFCTPQGVKELMYDTTSCLGNATVRYAPIDQCLHDTQENYWFKNICDPAPSNVTVVERYLTVNRK